MKNIILGLDRWRKTDRVFLLEEQVRFVLDSYIKQDRSISEIARKLEVYPQVVQHCLKRNGIVINSKRREPQKGERNPRWKGGRRLQKGYMQIKVPEHPNARRSDGYIFEHRLIMSRHLGRPLKDKEIVHHINGNTLDNRIKNLELISSNGKHISEHISSWPRNSFGRFSEEEDVPDRCIILEWKGQKHHIAEWARILGVSKSCLKWRIDHGKTGDALFAPSSRIKN